MTGRSPPLVGVQCLRAIAAISVLIGHIQSNLLADAAKTGLAARIIPAFAGGFGVDLFFCISGFIMVTSSARLFGRSDARSTFVWRRVSRLVPLYWAVTLLDLPMRIFGSHPYGGDLAVALLTSLLFIPYPTFGVDGQDVFPLYSLGWTLNYEMFFYGVFTIFIGWRRPQAVPSIALCVVLIVVSGLAFDPQSVELRFWSQPILLEFAFGLAIGWFWTVTAEQAGRTRRYGILRGLIAAALATLAVVIVIADPMRLTVKVDGMSTPNDLVRVLGWGLPAAALLAAALFAESRLRSPGRLLGAIVRIGDASYSLYLVHPFVLLLVSKLWLGLALHRLVGWGPMGVAQLGLAIAVARGIHASIERPLTHRLHRFVVAAT